ncbi:unnamed protein product [Adineta ricciae]|uniref:F-box domain-containing protein n=1 Tax=Adineta ricciae TaxID=249248 RepID=A0A815NH68_ADIRI|nr:unnamed protein product [Adineta ricciae]CAF1438232.1 unnamed protein product [Adineta ricciae]
MNNLQIVGEKLYLQTRFTPQRLEEKSKHVEEFPSLLKLSTEILHRIFDYLDIETLLFSLRYVCKQFHELILLYNRFKFDFESISISRLRYICHLINPELVIELRLSNDNKTPSQIEYFLSVCDLHHFTRLRSLIVIQNAKHFFTNLFDYVLTSRSLSSFSIYYLTRIEKVSKDHYYHTLTGPSLNSISSIFQRSNIKKFKSNLKSYQLETILRPIQYSFRHLTIQHCTKQQYYLILRYSPHLRTICLGRIKMNDEGYHSEGESSFASSSDEEESENNELICHSLVSLKFQRYKGSIENLKEILLLTPMLKHLEIVGQTKVTEFVTNTSMLKEFIPNALDLLQSIGVFLVIHIEDDNFPLGMNLFQMNEKRCRFTYEFLKSPEKIFFYSVPIPKIDIHYEIDFDRTTICTLKKINQNIQLKNRIKSTQLCFTDNVPFNFSQIRQSNGYVFPNVTDLEFRLTEFWPYNRKEFVSIMFNLSCITKISLRGNSSVYTDQFISQMEKQLREIFKQTKNLSELDLYSDHLLIAFDVDKIYSIIPQHVKYIKFPAVGLEKMRNIVDQFENLWSMEFAWSEHRMHRDRANKCEGLINHLQMKKRNFRYQKSFFSLLIWFNYINSECSIISDSDD